MKYLRYLLYLIITSVAFYYVSMSITQDKSLVGIIIGFIIMFVIVFPMMYLEFIKFQNKVDCNGGCETPAGKARRGGFRTARGKRVPGVEIIIRVL